MVLNKRIIREFKESKVKYLGLIFLILLSSMAIVGFADSTDSIMNTLSKYFVTNNCEDGSFVLKGGMDNLTLNKLKDLGIIVEENFYSDYKINEEQTIRVFKERKNINKLSLINGEKLKSINQIILDKKYVEANKNNIGDTIKISGKNYTVVGYGTVPDYTIVKKNQSDLVSDPKNFGIGFVEEEDFDNFKDKVYSYSFKVNGASIDDVRYILLKNTNLISFSKQVDNVRITGYVDDLNANKYVAILIGFLLCIMIGFVISISLINMIDKESTVIGALYSLGYIKKELLKHFMVLPTIIVGIGATIGSCLGFLIEEPLGMAISDMYCFPNIKIVYPPYLIFVGVFIPIITVVAVNYFILSNRLNSTPLQLLRKEKKESKLKNIKIKYFNFLTKFRMRQFLREINGSITLFVGVSFSMFVLILGLGMHDSINSYVEDIKRQAVVPYTYILNFPVHINDSKNTEQATIKGLSLYYEPLDTNMNVTLQGIKEDSKFYNFKIKNNDSGAYISNAVEKKFNLKVGDTIRLKDTTQNEVYAIKINGIVDYEIGLYVFMNKEQMNVIMKEGKSNYNAVLSREKLNINKDYIYSTLTAKNMAESAESIDSMLAPMQKLLIIFATILFVLMIYLLLKLMIDKSITGISLIKVFGFNKREVNKLYLGSNFYIILICLVFAIPLSISIYKIFWPYIISNMEAYIFVKLKAKTYLYIVIVTLGAYFFSNIFLKRHIDKISLSEALKNRD